MKRTKITGKPVQAKDKEKVSKPIKRTKVTGKPKQ